MRGHPKGRRRTPCRHCDMVMEYNQERERQEIAAENRRWSGPMITFKLWLQFYWEPEEEAA